MSDGKDTKISRYKTRSPSRGGPRPGSGRPAGQTNRITTQEILDRVWARTGEPYSAVLVDDWLAARATDPYLNHKYHTLIANKVLADQVDVTMQDSGAAVAARQAAFEAALERVRGLGLNKAEPGAPDATS